MAKRKKLNKVVSNSKLDANNVKNTTNPKSGNKLKFDFSFEGLYYSVRLSGDRFTNYLSGETEFVSKFRQIREINSKLMNENFLALQSNPNVHLHDISGDKKEIVLNCVGQALSKLYNSKYVSENIAQLLGNETIYQIGLNKGVRLIGTYKNDTGSFRIYLIDYHHRLYPDEKRNAHGKKELKFCPMKGK